MEARCLKCKELKPHTAFYRRTRSKNGLQDNCIDCDRKQRSASYRANRAHYAAYNRLKNYGIDQAQYDTMVQAQGGVCAICLEEPVEISKKGTYLGVDHDHRTGTVRGLLCHFCNAGLGGIERNASVDEAQARLLRAAEYINQTQ